MFQKKLWGIITILFLIIMLAACSEDANEPEPEENEQAEAAEMDTSESEDVETDTDEATVPSDEELLALLEENLQAFQELDQEGYLNTIHSESPAAKESAVLMEQLGSMTFNVELVDAEVIDKNKEEATVRYTQNTTSDEPGFSNNQTAGTHNLRLDGADWKIYSTVAEEVIPLDENGELLEEQTGETVLDSIEGEYAEAIQKLNLNFDDTVQVLDYVEDTGYATATMYTPNETYNGAQISVEYIQDAKDVVDPQIWVDSLKESFESEAGGNVEINEFDITDEEAMYEMKITGSDMYQDQVQLARGFFKDNDLYVVAFIVINHSELDKETKDEWVAKLKNVE